MEKNPAYSVTGALDRVNDHQYTMSVFPLIKLNNKFKLFLLTPSMSSFAKAVSVIELIFSY